MEKALHILTKIRSKIKDINKKQIFWNLFWGTPKVKLYGKFFNASLENKITLNEATRSVINVATDFKKLLQLITDQLDNNISFPRSLINKENIPFTSVLNKCTLQDLFLPFNTELVFLWKILIYDITTGNVFLQRCELKCKVFSQSA